LILLKHKKNLLIVSLIYFLVTKSDIVDFWRVKDETG